jgi:hypothetical protein
MPEEIDTNARPSKSVHFKGCFLGIGENMKKQHKIGNDLISFISKNTGIDAKRIIVVKASITCEVDNLPTVEMKFYIK